MYQNISKADRILHCPENVGNNAKRLSDFEKKQGITSWSISLRKEAFEFEADQTLVTSGSFFLGELARWKLLWIAITKFDVIHFNNGKTIMPHRVPFTSIRKRTNSLIAILYMPYAWLLEGKDVCLLVLFRKKILYTFQGSDARLSNHYTNLHPQHVLEKLNPDYISQESDKYKKKRIVCAEKHANEIYCLNPDLLRNFSTKTQFRPYYNVDINSVVSHKVFCNDSVHIVHAPSKRDIKGTSYIIDAVNNIRHNYPRVQFTLVENLSNTEAQKVYDTADLLIDQLIVGWYGGVSIELLARGVPVMCFLEDLSDITQVTRLRAQLPIINTNITDLENDLKSILSQPPEHLQTLGQIGQNFVTAFHTLK